MSHYQGIKNENNKCRLKQYVFAIKVNEAESSTEESDVSTEPNRHKQQLHSKPQKSKAHKEGPPPVWAPPFPGFPAGPPPTHAFRQVRRKNLHLFWLVGNQKWTDDGLFSCIILVI